MPQSQPNTTAVFKIDRRDFLKLGVASAPGLILGFSFGCESQRPEGQKPEFFFNPSVFVSIDNLGDVTIVAHRSEMGTGIRTVLPTIIADELEADWNRVKIVQAPGDEETYGDQNTDASYSARRFYHPMRVIGATARTMMEQAAANLWQVDASECQAVNHEVVHNHSNKKIGFGDLVQEASNLEVPNKEVVVLKHSRDFKLIGKDTSLYDLPAVVTGKAIFGTDVAVNGARVAVIARCPVAGGEVESFDAMEALKLPGVLEVFKLSSPGFPTGFSPLGGVVVVAENTWAAIKGRDALKVKWQAAVNGDYNSSHFLEEMKAKTTSNGNVRWEQGKLEEELKSASQVVEATYTLPHISHAPMEPPVALAEVEENHCTIWAPTQNPQWARESVANVLGFEVKDVTVNVTLIGGAFGRKSKPDFVMEAALVSRQIKAPVKLVWTREDDIRHDFYHACSVQRVQVGLSKDNQVLSWRHHSVFPSIGGTSRKEALEPSGNELGKGLLDLPYQLPAICIETHPAKAKTRIGWMRSVSNLQHAFAIGSMLDEVAVARKMDAVENLLDLLGPDRLIPFDEKIEKFYNYNEPLAEYPADTARMRRVIEVVAEKSQWDRRLPDGYGMGICSHRSSLSYVACVVVVKVNGEQVSIPEIHYAVDCGVVLNRDRVVSQFEGGAVFALGTALRSEINFDRGRVKESKYDDYQVALMTDAPGKIVVHIIDSDEKPTGVGEPPVPPIAPALCNAIFAATGKRIRELPIKLG